MSASARRCKLQTKEAKKNYSINETIKNWCWKTDIWIPCRAGIHFTNSHNTQAFIQPILAAHTPSIHPRKVQSVQNVDRQTHFPLLNKSITFFSSIFIIDKHSANNHHHTHTHINFAQKNPTKFAWIENEKKKNAKLLTNVEHKYKRLTIINKCKQKKRHTAQHIKHNLDNSSHTHEFVSQFSIESAWFAWNSGKFKLLGE